MTAVQEWAARSEMDLCKDESTCAIMSDNATSGNTTDFTACLNCLNDGEYVEQISHKIVVAVLTALLAFVIFIGNGLIIVSVCVVRKLRQPANYLIVSLAFSDFLVAIVVLPPTIVYDILGEWVLGPTICNIHVSFDVICCAASILNLVMISIDRYCMVSRPLTYPKKRTVKLMVVMICTAWTLACLVIFPALFGFTKNVTDDPDWIEIHPSGGFWTNTTACPPTLENHKLTDLRENGNLTYWTPYDSTHRAWQFAVNLEKDYKLTNVRFTGSRDSIFLFQLQMITQDDRDISEANFNLTQMEIGQITPTPATCIRIRFNSGHDIITTSRKQYRDWRLADSYHTKDIKNWYRRIPARRSAREEMVGVLLNGSDHDFANNVSFAVFGELTRGKTCLISQQRWFTIYSTFGSFYIPLAVMIFMYYKIYLEASSFKARHKARSKSLTDQSHSIFSQPMRRRGTVLVADDSCSDLTDFYFEYRHGAAETSPKRNTAISNLSPLKSCSPIEPATLIEEEDCLFTTPRDQTEYDALVPQVGQLADNANGIQSRAHNTNDDISQNCNLSEPETLSEDTRSFEVNGNIPDVNGTKTFSRSASWCKNLHYSTGTSFPSDASGLADHCQTNDRVTTVKTMPNKRNKTKKEQRIPEKSPFAREGRSILSMRRKSTATSNFTSVANGTKRAPPETSGRYKKGSVFFRRVSTLLHRKERLCNAKAIRTLGIIVIVFTFCWLPFFLLTFIRPFVCENPESNDCFPEWLVRLVLWLGYLNSALNPFIYVGFSPDLRKTFQFLICCKCTNVDRRLAQIELREAIEEERKMSACSRLENL